MLPIDLVPVHFEEIGKGLLLILIQELEEVIRSTGFYRNKARSLIGMATGLVEEWGGPFALKGVMSVADAKKAVEIGASAIMISNHGGRQLDGSRSPFDQLQAISDAVGGQIEIILDGGIRRGTHVLKALAMGATAVAIGRPYLWGLAAGGHRGVERVLELLQAELVRDMQLAGTPDIQSITPAFVTTRN